jgi:enterochelin esterase-like enzyme
MSKDTASVWSVTTPEALAPDLYPYTFTVDGVKGADPGNNNANAWAPVPSGSLLFVPGKPWSNLSTQHGAVAKHSYQSAIIGAPETYYVYTPANYDRQRKQAYPVMVLLHGLGDTAEAWIVQGGANLTLDSLIADGKAIPMIVVIPAGYGNAAGTRGAAAGFPNFTQALIEEMLPQVLKQYNASTRPEDHAITGLSMGGAQSLLLINHTDQFAWIGSFSPGFDMFNPARTVIPSPGGGPGGPGGPGAGAGGGRPNGPGGPGGPVVNPALASATPAAAPGGGTILARQRELLASGVLDKAFPSIAATGKKLKLLYVTCGTQDDHLFLTRQQMAGSSPDPRRTRRPLLLTSLRGQNCVWLREAELEIAEMSMAAVPNRKDPRSALKWVASEIAAVRTRNKVRRYRCPLRTTGPREWKERSHLRRNGLPGCRNELRSCARNAQTLGKNGTVPNRTCMPLGSTPNKGCA